MSENKFPINFSEIIDDYLYRGTRERRDDVFYPSEIGACMRQNYYRHKIPKEIPTDLLRLFRSGDMAHSFIRDVLARSSKVKLLTSEKPFSILVEDFEISGRLDDLIIAQVGDKKETIVVEVKSISGNGLKYTKEPKKFHLLQLHPYLRAAKTHLGLIWYVSRENYMDKFFVVNYDQKIMDEVMDRSRQLRRNLVECVLPAPEATLTNEKWRCFGCPYHQECKDNFNPQQKSST